MATPQELYAKAYITALRLQIQMMNRDARSKAKTQKARKSKAKRKLHNRRTKGIYPAMKR